MSESKQLGTLPEHLPTQKITAQAGETDIIVAPGISRYLIYQPADLSQDNPLRLRFHLTSPNSAVQVLGLVEAGETDTPTLNIELIHNAPRTRAETIVRALVRDQAYPHFTGKIHIGTLAEGSESYLNHHSLLLDPTARSWSLPSLEILTNEVKCSHAATMRHLTDHDFFYPRSRGLSSEQSQDLLITAFIADVALCKA